MASWPSGKKSEGDNRIRLPSEQQKSKLPIRMTATKIHPRRKNGEKEAFPWGVRGQAWTEDAAIKNSDRGCKAVKEQRGEEKTSQQHEACKRTKTFWKRHRYCEKCFLAVMRNHEFMPRYTR